MDVVGVVSPLIRGGAQVVLHGNQVVELSVLLGVHEKREVEEDGEGQVEVEKEEGEVKEKRTWMTMRIVRGVSWSEVATVPKRKSHRALDFNLSWNSEEDIWKGRKRSNGTKRKRRRVKRNNHNATHKCTCMDGMTRARRT